MNSQTAPIILSQGDVAGIGWELFLKLLLEKQFSSDILSRIIVVGDRFLNDKRYFKFFNCKPYSQISLDEKYTGKKPRFYYLNDGGSYVAGKPSAALALRSYNAFQKAIKLWQAHSYASLVTLPVSKEFISKSGVSFHGHTEVLQSAEKCKTYMCMYHKELSVVLLTNHIPLSKVSKALMTIDPERLANALSFFRALFNPKKQMAMCGVNPHAGENGTIGTEENVLRQYIEKLSKNGIPCKGPLPADGLFTKDSRKDFSLVIAAYHDQGLIPFKALYGLKGLNITLGLPRLRVSPDHGTAYSIAGTGKASPEGVKQAILFADKWSIQWATAFSSL